MLTLFITDRVGMDTYLVKEKISPLTVDELRAIITTHQPPFAVMGSNYSMGGQAMIENGTVIDMANLNNIVNFDAANKTITVEAGAIWRQIQEYIDPYHLSVQVMQSYNNFSVGGSLSVNAHARDVRFGPTIKSVMSFEIMLADGSVVLASRTKNTDLFNAAIGGYGLLGIIIRATITLTDNCALEQSIDIMNVKRYSGFFSHAIQQDKTIIFHSALLLPDTFNMLMCMNWHQIDDAPSLDKKFIKQQPFYFTDMLQQQLVARFSPLKSLRPLIEVSKNNPNLTIWRNYEMSYSVRQLEPLTRLFSTSILQEYFIPCAHIMPFIVTLQKIIKEHDINVINIALRHVKADKESILSYALQEMFAFVLYINIWNTTKSHEYTKEWTQKLIQAALDHSGTYYLPYHLYATQKQFESAYPSVIEFMKVKKKYDPSTAFQNTLYKKYMQNLGS
jgi:FAD/FMN-containing dehydrogenase